MRALCPLLVVSCNDLIITTSFAFNIYCVHVQASCPTRCCNLLFARCACARAVERVKLLTTDERRTAIKFQLSKEKQHSILLQRSKHGCYRYHRRPAFYVYSGYSIYCSQTYACLALRCMYVNLLMPDMSARDVGERHATRFMFVCSILHVRLRAATCTLQLTPRHNATLFYTQTAILISFHCTGLFSQLCLLNSMLNYSPC